MSKEYKVTTESYIKTEANIPIPPKGRNWRLVSVSVMENEILYWWERENIKKKSQSISYYIRSFESAVRAHAFKGSQDPLDHDAIERRYVDAKLALKRVIKHGNLS